MLQALKSAVSGPSLRVLRAASIPLGSFASQQCGREDLDVVSFKHFSSLVSCNPGLDWSRAGGGLALGKLHRWCSSGADPPQGGDSPGGDTPSGDTPAVTDELYCAMPQINNQEEQELLDKFVLGVKEGRIYLEEVVRGLKEGHIGRPDLNYLLQQGAINQFMYKDVITKAIGDTPKLTFSEILQLVKDGHVQKEDIIWMMQERMIVPGDIQYMIQKECMPADLGEEILTACQHLPKEYDHLGFSDITARVRSGELTAEGIAALVVNGQLATQDVDLLVEDGLVSKEDMEKISKDSQEEIQAALDQATSFAMLVEDGKVSFEELQVMRAKGVLGNSVIHFLVNQESITDNQGENLLNIKEDPESDGKAIEGVDRSYPDYEAFQVEVEEDVGENVEAAGSTDDSEESLEADSATPQPDMTAEGSNPEDEVDGFYPPHIDKDDIFALWEHLEKTYEHIPGLPPVEEILQEEADKEKDERKRKRLAEEAKQDIQREQVLDEWGNARAIGKRKCAISKVYLTKGTGEMMINRMSVGEYFKNIDARVHLIAPFVATGTLGQFDVWAKVKGGGLSAQAQALRHGFSRALERYNPEYRKILKPHGLLTRDAREVERKKPGKAKARKSFAWVKR